MLLSNFQKTARWMRRGGRDGDIVLCSRVRLARNFRRFQFPHHAGAQELMAVRKRVFEAIERADNPAPDDLLVVPFENYTPWERQSLIDRHLSSREHVRQELGRAVAATPDLSLAVIINEEDHWRVQTLLPGLQFDAAYTLADKLDDALEAELDEGGTVAYDEQFGYLTACPTNAGTGLRASAMLHLPGLEIAGRGDKTRRWAQTRGFELRGTFGEGSKIWGHLHQLSNQASMGIDEAEVLLETEAATSELVEMERAAREELPTEFKMQTLDRCGRAYGALRYARTISCREATDCLSYLRLAHELGWMKGMPRQRFNELLVWARPAYLQVLHGRPLEGAERDSLRADLLRPHVSKVRLEGEF